MKKNCRGAHLSEVWADDTACLNFLSELPFCQRMY